VTGLTQEDKTTHDKNKKMSNEDLPNRSKAENKNKDILDSLPVLEKLRGISRAGSIIDDSLSLVSGAQSETGDVACGSDKESATGIVTARVTRNSRYKPQEKPKKSYSSSTWR